MVAGARPGDHVLDPAAGEGGLLLALAGRAGGGLSLTGREAGEWAWRTAKARFSVRGMEADLGAGPSDSFSDQALSGSADVVVLDPPLGRRQVRRWLGAVPGMARPGGRAVVAVPEADLASGTTSRLPVLDLARLESVVAGPDRLRADLEAAMAVVVLSAEPVSGPVLVVDTSALARRRDTLNTFDPADLEELGPVLSTWRDEGRLVGSERLAARVVGRGDLAGGDLRPSRWMTGPGSPELARASERALELARSCGTWWTAPWHTGRPESTAGPCSASWTGWKGHGADPDQTESQQSEGSRPAS